MTHRRLFYCDSLSLDQYRCRDRARSEEALMKIVFLVVGPLFICSWAFLVRTRGWITPRAARRSTGRRRRGGRGLRYRPCLVRIAVAAPSGFVFCADPCRGQPPRAKAHQRASLSHGDATTWGHCRPRFFLPFGRLTSSNSGTWVLSDQDSSLAPQTLQDA
jgi:hypothetical protein